MSAEEHDTIPLPLGFEDPELLIPVLESLGLSLTRRNFKLSTASGTVFVQLVRQGIGIGILVKKDAELFPDLEPVLPSLSPIPVPTWLVTHRELHTSRRIRLVFDLLAESFAAKGAPA